MRTLVAAALLAAAPAFAQETVDIGVIKDADISVVQNVLFPKKERSEMGVHIGWMPFDPLVTTPNLQLSYDRHFTEDLALSMLIGGGYGLKTGKYVELESPAYGVAPYAFRYLASVLAGVEFSPVYAKLALGGAKVVHFDVFGTILGGATLESSVIPDGGITVAPTVSLGLGTRFFVGENVTLRVGFRDDLLVEFRQLTSSWHFKQNGGITVGVTFLSKRKGVR